MSGNTLIDRLVAEVQPFSGRKQASVRLSMTQRAWVVISTHD